MRRRSVMAWCGAAVVALNRRCGRWDRLFGGSTSSSDTHALFQMALSGTPMAMEEEMTRVLDGLSESTCDGGEDGWPRPAFICAVCVRVLLRGGAGAAPEGRRRRGHHQLRVSQGRHLQGRRAGEAAWRARCQGAMPAALACRRVLTGGDGCADPARDCAAAAVEVCAVLVGDVAGAVADAPGASVHGV